MFAMFTLGPGLVILFGLSVIAASIVLIVLLVTRGGRDVQIIQLTPHTRVFRAKSDVMDIMRAVLELSRR